MSPPRAEYVRFGLRPRLEHVAVMLLFLVLAVTGFPQKFFGAAWAAWTIDALGGIDTVRWLHRMAGIVFAALTVVHLGVALTLVLSGRSGWTMLPTRKDFADVVLMLRYYLGLSEEHARFGRFDYRQKFEYWGLVLGGLMMIVTGFMLYLPALTTRFLPGELIPAAKVAHSNEGLLAFLVVIIWHIYNAHLAPEVFPFDPSIFTGRVTREFMEKEHPLELSGEEESGIRRVEGGGHAR